MTLLTQLKNLTLDRNQVDELIELYTAGKSYLSTYTEFSLPVPDWLTESMRDLSAEINGRRRDMLIARQKEIARSLSTLKTREERRQELEAEQARLNDALGSGQTKQQP